MVPVGAGEASTNERLFLERLDHQCDNAVSCGRNEYVVVCSKANPRWWKPGGKVHRISFLSSGVSAEKYYSDPERRSAEVAVLTTAGAFVTLARVP
jgi:hypothetical protein